jgi:hypothetical protein
MCTLPEIDWFHVYFHVRRVDVWVLEERFLIIYHHHMKLCFIHEMPLLVPTHSDLWRNLC